jgi:hypothetical protein
MTSGVAWPVDNPISRVANVGAPAHGALLLFEPAFDAFRRADDVTVHSIHRYRRHDLAALAVDEPAGAAASVLRPAAERSVGVDRARACAARQVPASTRR